MLKNLLLLSGFSTFAVIAIVAFNIYHNYTLSSLPEVTQTRALSIPSTFDSQTIESLRSRKPIQVDLQEKTGVISEDSKNSSTTPVEPEKTPEASRSATQLIQQ
jgi:hypothetical protein